MKTCLGVLVGLCIGISNAQQHLRIKPIGKQIGNKNTLAWNDWFVIAKLTFKNSAHTPIFLHELILKWHGTPFNSLVGSLFYKKHHRHLIATQEHCLADSIWNTVTQELIFTLDSPLKITTHTPLYFTLILPSSAHSSLQTGFFTAFPNKLSGTWPTPHDGYMIPVLCR